jgi:hypothetical protein
MSTVVLAKKAEHIGDYMELQRILPRDYHSFSPRGKSSMWRAASRTSSTGMGLVPLTGSTSRTIGMGIPSRRRFVQARSKWKRVALKAV